MTKLRLGKYAAAYLKLGLAISAGLFSLAYIFSQMSTPLSAQNYHMYKYCFQAASTAATALSLSIAGTFLIGYYEKPTR